VTFFNYDNDLRQKIHKFQYACGTIKRTLRNKARKDTMLGHELGRQKSS
jgi:hypothetical protein